MQSTELLTKTQIALKNSVLINEDLDGMPPAQRSISELNRLLRDDICFARFKDAISAISKCLDDFIRKTLRSESSSENYFGEYSKAIFQSMVDGFDSTSYIEFNQTKRIKYIENLCTRMFIDGVCVNRPKNTLDENHFKLKNFIDQSIKTLSLELKLKATINTYLTSINNPPSDPESLKLLSFYFAKTMKQYFLRAEPIFYELFKGSNKTEQCQLIELLNIDFPFEPKNEYYQAAKINFIDKLKECTFYNDLLDFDPNAHFVFCSTIDKDDELAALCFEKLAQLAEDPSKIDQRRNTAIGSWLELLSKIKAIKLDSNFLNTLECIFKELITEQKHSEDITENISFILQIVLNADPSDTFISKNLEDSVVSLLNDCNKLLNEDELGKYDRRNIEMQAINALLVLNRISTLSEKNIKILTRFVRDDFSSLKDSVKTLLNPVQTITEVKSKFNQNFNQLRSSDYNPTDIEKKESLLISSAFSFAKPESISYLLNNNFGQREEGRPPLNSCIKLNRINSYLKDSKILRNNPEEFEHYKNEFLNHLLFASNSYHDKIRKLAKTLLFLFPDEVISKAFAYIKTNEKRLTLLGIQTINLFTHNDLQSFLFGYLQRNPNSKEKFQVTNAYQDLKNIAREGDENLKNRINNFERSLQSIGFKFSVAA